MKVFTRRVLFFLFFLSGFSSLVYQVVWTRMAFASFGIITPVLSVVLSVFMLGLALGSWAGGRWIPALTGKTGLSAAFFYAGAELVIGLGAFAVPKLFAVGENLLLASGETDSFRYLALSALVLAAVILPWCVCMGATFPFMMAYIRERDDRSAESFSFLYLANVLGAMSGTFLAAVVWIEVLGFHHTLWLAAAGNFTIAFISGCLGWEQRTSTRLAAETDDAAGAANASTASEPPDTPQTGMIKWILFSTGFIAMAMEVVWTRAFTPVLKTQVYSFAMIVFAYLGATFWGSWMYRRDLRANRPMSKPDLIAALAVVVFLPVLLNDPRIVVASYWTADINLFSALLLLAGIFPFCALLGYLTPGLIDEYAGGNPTRAGRAYAINVLGCILGPLFACYGLLPRVSERFSLILLALPVFVFCFFLRRGYSRRLNWALPAVLALALGWSAFGTEDFEGMLQKTIRGGTVVRRDYAATVISFGDGFGRSLLVNGIGMTKLTPITKFMVHLPLAYHQGPPQSALVICFGMGTTYRSAMSWNIDTTVVELVPSVTKAFGFYHADAARSVNATNGHIITDDGRRFLRRTAKKFDVIVVDPPPPVQAAGSSLLFSREFYELAKQHLKPGGILQMWFPDDPDALTCKAVIRSFQESFPQVRRFPSVEGWGAHLLGSLDPIEQLATGELAARLPASARQDLLEWNDVKDAPAFLDRVLSHEYRLPGLLDADAAIQVTDDQPFNEYYLLRRLLRHRDDPAAVKP
jgi:predicted membrane-bound spermidine synthase